MTRIGRVPIPAGGREMRGVLALPEADEPRPAVIVVFEVLGLNRDIRDKCLRLAEMGYAALAPDLYDGRGPMPICILRTMRSLNARTGPAFDDLDAAREYLANRKEVDGSRIGVIGFCMGGGFALLYAARAPIGAAAVFYGPVPADPSAIEDACPIVASYAGKDRFIGNQADRLKRHLDEVGIEHDFRVYPDATHSYMSDHKGVLAALTSWGPLKIAYHPEAAEDSWRRVEAFFGQHLAAPDAATQSP